MIKESFINYISGLVVKQPSDFFNSVSVAQACLETGFGTSDLYRGFNNAFGYKAKKGEWSGKVAGDYKSDEEINGVLVKDVPSDFRAYDSVEDSVKDHAYMMTSRGQRYKDIYKDAINAKTPHEQAHALTNKYAGDSRYGDKLAEIIDEYDLTQYDERNETMAKLTLEQAFAKLGLPFKKQLLPLTKTYGRVNSKKGIVLHQTGAPAKGANAQAMANYQANMAKPGNREEKSWHYQVDDTQVIMSFEHDVAAWQASDGKGPGNMAHISIESCINADGNYAKGIDNLAKTIAVIAYVEGFDIERQTKRHYDFARDKKWCPAQIMNGQQGFTYAKVKSMAQGHLDTLNGAKVTSSANPQGLKTIKIPAYKAPAMEFDKLEVGQEVTIRDPFNWYDDKNKVFMVSKKEKDIIGTKDKIKAIKDIEPIGYSKVAYLLEGYNSWILEQDLVNARASWTKVEVPEVDDKDTVAEIEEGMFRLGDTWYKVSEVE